MVVFVYRWWILSNAQDMQIKSFTCKTGLTNSKARNKLFLVSLAGLFTLFRNVNDCKSLFFNSSTSFAKVLPQWTEYSFSFNPFLYLSVWIGVVDFLFLFFFYFVVCCVSSADNKIKGRRKEMQLCLHLAQFVVASRTA